VTSFAGPLALVAGDTKKEIAARNALPAKTRIALFIKSSEHVSGSTAVPK